MLSRYLLEEPSGSVVEGVVVNLGYQVDRLDCVGLLIGAEECMVSNTGVMFAN